MKIIHDHAPYARAGYAAEDSRICGWLAQGLEGWRMRQNLAAR